MDIERRYKKETFSIATSGAISSNAIDMSVYAGGLLLYPAALANTTAIAFKVCDTIGGTYLPLYDSSNALIALTITTAAARAVPLPDELFGGFFVKLWTQASGSDVKQTALDFTVLLKG